MPEKHPTETAVISLAEDKELVQEIRAAIKENNGYCPCRLEKTPDTKCMCKDFRDQINRGEQGACHCGLYVFTIIQEE